MSPKIIMLRFIFLIGVLFASLTDSLSQEKALLYEISGKELAQPSYLFGTFHLLCKSDFILSDSLKNKFQKSEQLVLELDMDDPNMMMAMMKGIKMKGDTTLKNLFSDSDYAYLNQYFSDSLKMSLKMMERIKPFMLYSLMIPSLLDCPVVAFEMELTSLAKKQNKEILGLESFEFQMGVFDAISYNKQAEYLLGSIKDSKSSKLELQKLLKVYLSKDIHELEKAIGDSDKMFKDFEDILLKKRNEDWLSKIMDFAIQKPTFFAVGAGHLAGNNGIINLLKKQGYGVKAIE